MKNSVVSFDNPLSALFAGPPHVDSSVVFVIIFLVACLIFSTMSTVLLYHWNRYGMNNSKIIFARIVYITVSIVIIGAAFVALTFI